jgi:lipopolysaccharide/colanic/teichoic acid biosynthesis glycosyltransferase
MRRGELDELPQLWEVVLGKLALVGVRATGLDAQNYMRDAGLEGFCEWEEIYKEGKPGVLSLNSAMNPERKDSMTRLPYDMRYAEGASLEMDVYIVCRTGLRLWGEWRRKGVSEG